MLLSTTTKTGRDTTKTGRDTTKLDFCHYDITIVFKEVNMEDGIDETKMPVDLNQNGENSIVKKAQQLVSARYNLSVTEIKIICTLISLVKVTDEEFHEYIFRVADWKNDLKLQRKDIYKALEEVADDLLKKPFTIRDGEDWLKMNWISSARYVKKQGIVKFKISDELKPYLLELKKNFLTYDIKNILPIRSAYSIRIYEIVKDWWSIEIRYKKTKEVIKIVDLQWIRKTLQIPESYKYGDIKKQILQKSKADLEKYTDIAFTFEEIKTGRKVTHIKFYIKQKAKTQKKLTYTSNTARQTAIAMLALLPEKYRTTAAEKLLQKYHSKGVEYIKAQTEYTDKANATNYLAYLRNALQGDFAGFEKSDLTTEIKIKQKTEASEQKRAKQKKEQKEKNKKIKEKEEIAKIEKYFANMTENEQDKIKKEALLRLHEKHPNAATSSPTFGELSVEIAIKKILQERLDALDQ